MSTTRLLITKGIFYGDAASQIGNAEQNKLNSAVMPPASWYVHLH